MRSRAIGILFVACAVVIAMMSAYPAWTQSASAEKPIMYTYVSEWAVPRAMWAEYQKLEGADNDAMRKAVADGTLIAFGSFAVLNHQEGQPTHGTWFSANSIANLIKVLEGLRSAPAATAPPLAASKHWDYFLQSRDYNAHSGTFTNGYLRVGFWRFKAGASDPGGRIRKATIGAMLEKLLADGALHSYQIDSENVHSQDPDEFFIGIVTNGAEGLDKFYAALEEADKNNPAGLAGYDSLLDSRGHHDFLAHVNTMTHK